jgi:hypothetical protein
MNTLNWYFLKFGYLFSKWWKIKDYKWSSLKKKKKKKSGLVKGATWVRISRNMMLKKDEIYAY